MAGNQIGGVQCPGSAGTGLGSDGAAGIESLLEALLGGGVYLQLRHRQPQCLVDTLGARRPELWGDGGGTGAATCSATAWPSLPAGHTPAPGTWSRAARGNAGLRASAGSWTRTLPPAADTAATPLAPSRSRAAGFDAHLAKPLDLADLDRLLTRWTENWTRPLHRRTDRPPRGTTGRSSKTGQQAQARNDIELELLPRGLSAFPNEPVDQGAPEGGHRWTVPS